MSKISILSNSISRKNFMALTGLFLCFFLVIHLAGNLQLLLPAEKAHWQYNYYSELLTHNYLIKFISYVLYFSILAHIADAAVLTWQNWRARGKQGYVYDRRRAASTWYSRNMGLLGSLILVFLVIHLKDFWYVYKFGEMALDADGQKDIYTIVVGVYQDWRYVVLYTVSLLVLGFHLLHGFFSAFESLGLFHTRYAKWMKALGWLYTAAITGGFIAIPIVVFFLRN